MGTSPASSYFTSEENERLAGLLDAEQWDRLTQLMEQPERHMEALRADLDLQAAIARADVVPRLRTWFAPEPGRGTAGWEHAPERSGPVGPASVVVEWSFAGTYAQAAPGADQPRTPFNGVLALGQPIELQGATFMGVEGGAFRLRRHIDWTGLYTQLGLSVNWRTPLDAGTGRRRPPA